jgi:hypothetical protein
MSLAKKDMEKLYRIVSEENAMGERIEGYMQCRTGAHAPAAITYT